MLELGQGYAFVGQEKRLFFSESELFTDLLFFHIPTLRYVVIEVKLGKFKPEFLSQLSTYVAIIDEKFKKDKINSTIGILICEEGDDGLIKISTSTINVPIAISKITGYNIIDEMPEIKELENYINAQLKNSK